MLAVGCQAPDIFVVKISGELHADRYRSSEIRQQLRVNGVSGFHYWIPKLINTNPPYHNHQHCFGVALAALWGAKVENLSIADRRALLLAGIYHDYLHQGDGKLPDKVNTQRSLRWSKLWLKVFSRGLTTSGRHKIARLIADTENTYKVAPSSPAGGVLRDADLIMALGSDANSWFNRLTHELGRRVDSESTVKFLDDNITTSWGKQVLEEYKKVGHVKGLGW